jgi:serralysin
MSNSAQKSLDAILSILETNDELKSFKPGRGRKFRSSAKSDVFIGDRRNETVDGKGGSDILLGNAGNDRLRGANGNDVLFGGLGTDVLDGGNNLDVLYGGEGDDQLDGGNGADSLYGGVGIDALLGGRGADQIVGGAGIDTLTGGNDRDQFVYSGNMFANGTPLPAGQTGIKALNQPDVIKDYTIGEDQFALDKLDLDLKDLVFQKGQAAQIAGDGNVIVLTNGFAAAGGAARAIANNNNIQSDEGIFVYFNTTLGLTRAVYSKDLGDGGDISVLANLDNQRGQAGLTNINNFTAADFTLI